MLFRSCLEARPQQSGRVVLFATRKLAVIAAGVGVPHFNERTGEGLAVRAQHTARDDQAFLATGAAGAKLGLFRGVLRVKRAQLVARRRPALLGRQYGGGPCTQRKPGGKQAAPRERSHLQGYGLGCERRPMRHRHFKRRARGACVITDARNAALWCARQA